MLTEMQSLLLHFKDVFLSKEQKDFYVEEKVVLKKDRAEEIPRSSEAECLGGRACAPKSWDFTGEGEKKRDKDKNKCLMPSKEGASVKQCAQGCAGFPRAVLCSSSSEFLERSLLPCSWNSLDCRASAAVEVETQSVGTMDSTNKRVPGKATSSKQTFRGPQTFITAQWRFLEPGTARQVAGFGKQGFGDVDLLCYQHLFSLRYLSYGMAHPRSELEQHRVALADPIVP